MFVERKILILLVSILSYAVVLAQREKIDSLKKVLLTAKDKQRINCLNTLSKAYLFSGSATDERLEKERLKNEFNVQQLESEKKQSDLYNKTIELEMQALRAQMNPHFIFNSLNSINRFILQNNK